MGFIPQGMPFTALPNALRGKLQPNQLAVLWVIQSYAGANLESWPSLQTIADGACVSVRTARSVIGQLISLGFLQRSYRIDEQRNQSSNLYRVNIAHLANQPDLGDLPPGTICRPPGSSCLPPRQDMPAPPAGDAAYINTGNKKRGTKELTVGSKANSRKAKDYSLEFLGFWISYQKIPKRASGQSKPKAWAEWQKLPKATQQALERALKLALKEQAATELKGGFAAAFPDCFRWLRDGRYEAHLETATSQPACPVNARQALPTGADPF
nr:putative viral A-type inclusion protein repeat containing protein [uncultured Mediterranean phage uvMED]